MLVDSIGSFSVSRESTVISLLNCFTEAKLRLKRQECKYGGPRLHGGERVKGTNQRSGAPVYEGQFLEKGGLTVQKPLKGLLETKCSRAHHITSTGQVR